jgi:hypothetical protein
MRTTIRMNADLARRAKQYATQHDTTFTHVVEQAVTQLLSAPKIRKRRKKIRVPTYRGRGVQAGVDLNDTSALLDHIEMDLPLERRR